MTTQRQVRHAALQVLYMLDSGKGSADVEVVRPLLLELIEDPAGVETAMELALATWRAIEDADTAIAPVCPDWPINRQPIIDRNILRMAWFEMTSGQTPPKAAINEAIELAREFSTDRSPAFVNGVLDKILREMSTHASPPPVVSDDASVSDEAPA